MAFGLQRQKKGETGFADLGDEEWVEEGDVVRVIVTCDRPPEISVAGEALPVRAFAKRIPTQWWADLPIKQWAGLVSGVVCIDGQPPEIFTVKVAPSPDKGGRETLLDMIEVIVRHDAALPWGFSPGWLSCPTDADTRILPVRVTLALGLGWQVAAQSQALLKQPPVCWQKGGMKRVGKDVLRASDLAAVAASPRLAMQLHAARHADLRLGRPPEIPGGVARVPDPDLRLLMEYLQQTVGFVGQTRSQLKGVRAPDDISKAHRTRLDASFCKLKGTLDALLRRLLLLAGGTPPATSRPAADGRVAAIGVLVRRMQGAGAALDRHVAAQLPDGVEVGLRSAFGLFELYSMVWCVRQIDSRLVGWRRESPAYAADGGALPAHDYVWHAPGGSGVTVRLGVQKQFAAYVSSNGEEHGSLSGLRIPDFVLAIFDGDQLRRWVVVDAKFRSRLDSIHKALADIHVYRDGLHWQDKEAAAALILVPGLEGRARAFAEPDYRGKHKFGAVVLPMTRGIVADPAAQAMLDMLFGEDSRWLDPHGVPPG